MTDEAWYPLDEDVPPDDEILETPVRSGIGTRTLVLVAVLAAVLGAALAGLVVTLVLDGDSGPERVIERVETQIVPAQAEGLPTATAVARRVLPSIVTVEVGDGRAGSFLADGSGSGVVIDAEEGLLVTNQHVVDGAGTVRVIFANGRGYDAEVIGEDELTDLAVLRIQAEGLTAVELGSADALEIGDSAIAIGSPLGLEGGPSVTVGVVSAFDRRVQTNGSQLFGMLQTDAPITRGSSGGALVDTEGRLIGITTAIGVSDVGAEGLGFAIPIDMVTRITDELVEAGTVQHAFLGIQGSTFFSDEPDGATVPAGVVVAVVIDGAAAEQAGVQAGDVIRSFNGTPVVTMEKLVVDLRFYRVGDIVQIEVDRGGEIRTIDVTLLARPENV
jgi:S1-C subfamily serine protease